MTVEHVLIVVALGGGLTGGYLLARSRLRGRRSERPRAIHQILLPFTGTEISRRAVDAALRLARAEEATLMPAYLAAVPKQLPLDCSIPAEAATAMPMLEAIEQRATAQGVAVDSRIERGRSYRHALARLLDRESFDRVVVPATAEVGAGFSGDDLVWLLEKAPAEVLILRPGPGDEVVVAANGGRAAGGGLADRRAILRR
ncbi:MAG TPA: universal stress protein [Solirubrobacterales bacterium]|nr:universal stress protein [Solirubrobacterales bacterium]